MADLTDVLESIAVHSPRGSRNVQARIRSIIDLLLDHPRIGRVTEDPTIRKVVATPYPYLIFYEAQADEIIVHAVRHAARDPASMPGEPQ